MYQLCNERVKVVQLKKLNGSKSSHLTVGTDDIEEKLGVRVEQLLDYMALVGDTADNIPGVNGVGPKIASKLLGSHQV